jgi:Protein of unknown function (DUF3106)
MLRAVLFVLALFSAGALAQAPEKAKPAAKPPSAKAQNRPAWAQLTADQQMVLAPLKADWESLEPERRRKWLGIANRYPKMKLEEQERVQRRMHAWAKLSPEQRRQARENYKRIVKTPPGKRERLREAWAEYQALPPNERQNLAPPAPPPVEKKRR